MSSESTKPDYLKLVEPYIQRAQEIAAVDPVVSYFCKYYAARLAITASTSADRDAYLAQLLDQLEAEKQRIGDNESMRDDIAASVHVTGFALRVFAKADTEDREGRASKATARTFIVASQFLQVVASFGEVPKDVAEKIKYAKWRAAEILKAAREGRDPPPVPGGGNESNKAVVASPPPSSSLSDDILGWPSPPPPPPPASQAPHIAYPDPRSMSPPPPVVQNHMSFHMPPASSNSPAFIPVPAACLPPPPPPVVATAASQAAVAASSDPDQMLDPAVAKKAQKLARWAMSALEYDDVSNAIENLREAIKVLAPYNNKQ